MIEYTLRTNVEDADIEELVILVSRIYRYIEKKNRLADLCFHVDRPMRLHHSLAQSHAETHCGRDRLYVNIFFQSLIQRYYPYCLYSEIGKRKLAAGEDEYRVCVCA